MSNDEKIKMASYYKEVWASNPGLKEKFSEACQAANEVYPPKRNGKKMYG